MFFLLSANLVDAITKVSNTSGTYGAFLKIDDQRKYRPLELLPYQFTDNGQSNEAYCMSITELIDRVSGDILYLDPPYNGRQYPPYYHILKPLSSTMNPQFMELPAGVHIRNCSLHFA